MCTARTLSDSLAPRQVSSLPVSCAPAKLTPPSALHSVSALLSLHTALSGRFFVATVQGPAAVALLVTGTCTAHTATSIEAAGLLKASSAQLSSSNFKIPPTDIVDTGNPHTS